MNHQGLTLWFTGLSGAGKSTIALGVMNQLQARNFRVEILDGDVIRTHLSKGWGFSKEDRDINIRRVGFIAGLLSRNGIIAIVAAISPYREIRDEIRCNTTNFVEVYVKAPLDVCEARDVKGLYAKARAGEIYNFTGIDDPYTGRGGWLWVIGGEIYNFTGIDDPYEVPLNPEIVCNTNLKSVEESVIKVILELENMGYIFTGWHSVINKFCVFCPLQISQSGF